jgi:rare lipoprotein A
MSNANFSRVFIGLTALSLALSANAFATRSDDPQPEAPATLAAEPSDDQSFDYEVLVLDPAQVGPYMQAEGITEDDLAQADQQAMLEEQINVGGDAVASIGRYNHRQPKAQKRTCTARSGNASWYGPGFHGKKTACGGRFNQNALTAAHKTIKCGSRVKVSYGGKSVVVTINDAGPYHGDRVIDLSKASAQAIGLSTGFVQLQVLKCAK